MRPPSNTIEALLFDLGGVVIEVDFDRVFRRWAEQSRLSFQEIRSRFAMDAMYARHERGELAAHEYFGYLRGVLQLGGNEAEIIEGWNEIYIGEITETLNDIVAISKQLPCYALTNTNPTHQAVWERLFPRVIATFKQVFVSSEMGLRKPERAAYTAVAERISVHPPRILFFDDAPENVAGAIAAGMQGVIVRSPGDVKIALAGLGVL
jgi:putative hydrolase of the HAD superfamily